MYKLQALKTHLRNMVEVLEDDLSIEGLSEITKIALKEQLNQTLMALMAVESIEEDIKRSNSSDLAVSE